MGDVPAVTTTTTRYAPYIESLHMQFLSALQGEIDSKLAEGNPYEDYNPLNQYTDLAFVSATLTLNDFPALYDMFGKHMAAMDIEQVWGISFDQVVSTDVVEQMTAKRCALMDDTMDSKTIPEYKRSMRELNATNSSTYVAGLAYLECQRVREREKISETARILLLPVANSKWVMNLNFSADTLKRHARLMLEYYCGKLVIDDYSYVMKVKKTLWDFQIINAMQRGISLLYPRTKISTIIAKKASVGPIARAVGVIGWMYIGYQIGSYWPPYGGIIGAVVGAVIGIAQWVFDF